MLRERWREALAGGRRSSEYSLKMASRLAMVLFSRTLIQLASETASKSVHSAPSPPAGWNYLRIHIALERDIEFSVLVWVCKWDNKCGSFYLVNSCDVFFPRCGEGEGREREKRVKIEIRLFAQHAPTPPLPPQGFQKKKKKTYRCQAAQYDHRTSFQKPFPPA